ncbi:MAG: Brp/Blh family beta-carotene 15,15'-dioxygenase [Candidatus Eremiobacteraeota bacterium]|nr:Brp/Blh family beta-carotene 15,15'-dioxygenase [Candidatus Eremiobacteraeota bacterium]
MKRDRTNFMHAARSATWVASAVLGFGATVAPKVVRAIVAALTATIGIAHGATDAAMLDRLGVRPGKWKISIAYGVVAIATYLVARRYPVAAARALRLVSWAHFGSGDAAFARACGSRRPELAESFVRGGIPLSIGGRDARSAWSFIAASSYAALTATGRSGIADSVDVAVPSAVLYAAPARLGFGVYFAAWHAPRHLALLLERDVRGGPYVDRFRRFAREAAPNVAIAGAFGALAYALRGPSDGAEELVGALILGITVPHQIAVWIIEYRSRASASAAS